MTNCLSRIHILLLVLFPLSLTAQNDNSTSQSAIEIGRDLLSVKQYDSAIIYFEKAIQIADQKKDYWNKSLAQSELGRAWIAVSEYDKALKISNSILNDDKASIRARVISHQNIANFYGRKSNDPKKEAFHNHKALKSATDQKSIHFENPTSNDSLDLSNRMLALDVLGEMHRERQVFDSAQYYLKELIELSVNSESSDPYNLALYKTKYGNVFINQRKLAEAKKVFSSTLPLIEKLPLVKQRDYNLVATFYDYLGVNYNLEGNLDSSIFAKTKQEQIMSSGPRVDSVLLARSLSYMSVDYYYLGDLIKAFEHEQRAFTLKKRLLGQDHPEIARSYKLLGLYRIRQSDAANDAVEYFRENLRIHLKLYGEMDRRTVDALHHLSVGLNAIDDYSESLKIGQEALAIQKKIRASDYMTAVIYTSIALNLTELKRLGEAVSIYDEMINLLNTSEEDLSVLNVNSRTGLSLIYEQLEEYERAEKYLREAAEYIIGVNGPNDRRLINIYHNTSVMLEKQGLIEDALEEIQKSLKVNSFDETIFKTDSKPLSLIAKTSGSYMTSYIQYTSLLLQRQSQLGTVDLTEFWEVFDNSLKFFSDMLSEQTNSSDIISLQSDNNSIYSIGMDALWLVDSLQQEENTSFKMWQLSDMSKGVNQKLNEKRRQASYPLESTSKILEEQRRSLDKISFYKTLALNGNEHDSVQAGLFQALQAKKNSEAQLKSEYPIDYSLSHLDDNIQYESVKNFIEDDNNILDYFIADRSLYAFLINSSGSYSFKFDWSQELQNNIQSFKKAIVNDSTDLFDSISQQIYTQIFEPIESKLVGNNLIIIPDKDLWNLNFDLLIRTPSNESTGKDYLIRTYAISYSHSTSLLLEGGKKGKSRNQILAFSYAENNTSELRLDNMRDEPKENLPGTARELKNLETSLNGKFYYGREANEARFKEAASDYAILHLALHGEVNDEDPDNSKLYFTKGLQMGDEDNALHTFELYNMKLNASLAVLSACNTGNGKISDGEGVMSLGKAFQYAGVNSVLLSQWEVSDATTPAIMNSFYQNLKDGKSKSESLRLAKLDFLNNSNNITSSPYYWGSFFIIGDPNPIDLSSRGNQWYWLIGLVLVALFVISKKRFRGTEA